MSQILVCAEKLQFLLNPNFYQVQITNQSHPASILIGNASCTEHDLGEHDDGDVYDDFDDGNLRKASQEEWWQDQARLLGKPPPTLSAPFSLASSFVFVLLHCRLTENHF